MFITVGTAPVKVTSSSALLAHIIKWFHGSGVFQEKLGFVNMPSLRFINSGPLKVLNIRKKTSVGIEGRATSYNGICIDMNH